MQCGLRGPWPSQCGIDDNGSNKRKTPVNKGQVSQEMTNAGVVYNVLLPALPSWYVQVQGREL